jgi:hypothetical protein
LRGEIHLVPDALDLRRITAFEEAGEMLLDQIASGLAACGDGEADRTVFGLDLDHERAEHVDAEAAARLTIFGIFRHRRGDMVIDPMAVRLIVIIRAAAAHDARADLLDAGKRHATAPICSVRQAAREF